MSVSTNQKQIQMHTYPCAHTRKHPRAHAQVHAHGGSNAYTQTYTFVSIRCTCLFTSNWIVLRFKREKGLVFTFPDELFFDPLLLLSLSLDFFFFLSFSDFSSDFFLELAFFLSWSLLVRSGESMPRWREMASERRAFSQESKPVNDVLQTSWWQQHTCRILGWRQLFGRYSLGSRFWSVLYVLGEIWK